MYNTKDVIELQFLTEDECKVIKDFFHWKEEELIRDGFGDFRIHQSYDNVLTSNYFRYNFFHYFPDLADRLVVMLATVFQPNELEWPIAVQAWCNIYRNNQGIDWHNHQGIMGKSWTANVFIDGPDDSKILYKHFGEKTKSIQNKKGFIHILPCDLYHKVPENSSEEVRYTIGMTIHSYPTISRTVIDRYAFNSKTYQDTVILTKEHLDGDTPQS